MTTAGLYASIPPQQFNSRRLPFLCVAGNLLRLSDGRLCYLDFGMMGSVDSTTRMALIRATLHLVNREFPSLTEDLMTLGFLPQGTDKSTVVPAITSVFEVSSIGPLGKVVHNDAHSYTIIGTYSHLLASIRIPSYSFAFTRTHLHPLTHICRLLQPFPLPCRVIHLQSGLLTFCHVRLHSFPYICIH